MSDRLGGYYWVRPITDGPWVIQRWDVSEDGDCGWLGKPYDWNPAEVGERIPHPDEPQCSCLEVFGEDPGCPVHRPCSRCLGTGYATQQDFNSSDCAHCSGTGFEP